MFGLLSSSQIYGLQQAHEHNPHNSNNNNHTSVPQTAQSSQNHNNNNNNAQKQRRSSSSLSDSGKESKFFATLSSMQSIKSPTNFIEKFLRSELLNGYDTIKNYKNFQHSSGNSACTAPHANAAAGAAKQQQTTAAGHGAHPERILASFNCLQGSYRSSCDSEFYEAVNVNSQQPATAAAKTEPEMTIKYSKNLLANAPDEQAPATLQNYQKLPECEQELPLAASSGASSGEFNSDSNAGSTSANNLYKRLSFGGRGTKHLDATNEVVSDYSSSTNSSSSMSTATKSASSAQSSGHHTAGLSGKSHDLQRTSSASSSGDCTTTRERTKTLLGAMSQQRHASEHTSSGTPVAAAANNGAGTETAPTATATATATKCAAHPTPERAQRRKLIQMISHYDQQNKLLQRELAKEKRRRSEELACVAKSLICFESKLKRDMKSVNQRLLEKDAEICRLVRQNRALRKRLAKVEEAAGENARDEGVVEDGEAELAELERAGSDKALLLEDCLVLEALQCINCRKQFYDIDLKEGWTQTATKDGSRNNDDHTTEHGSSSDDTVSSSFYGARRSVRYTSKRTSGTFRDYMRSRSMNIDDPALDQNSEENTSTISRDDSQASYEKMNMYSRTIERMHGVKCESERDSEQSGVENARSASRLSSKSGKSTMSSSSRGGKASDKSVSSAQLEEDDGIFSPTQDDDFEEADLGAGGRSIKIVVRRSTEFSEASPKQVYETSTDDWYASASDQEEMGGSTAAAKSYGQGAVNPVLECVNQILLQQSMEESLHESANNSVDASASSGSDNAPAQTQQLTPKPPNHLQVNANLPRRSSLSGRRSSRSNSRSSDGQPSRNGTLTRKRVHFSTKNSMVHVPRNDEHDDDNHDDSGNEMISTLQQYHPMNYFPASPQQQPQQQQSPGGRATAMLAEVSERERLETLNYESIYSNEYEPIGSEHNSSNLYVDMESTVKMANSGVASPLDAKMPKMPPALPPKPANLVKFKKSLQQLDEVPDEHLHQDCAASSSSSTNAAPSEPDYCSISEVNGITSVQIVADVHKAPESEPDPGSPRSLNAPLSELDVEVSTVASDDTCAASQKTDEIEEIFADIPKLPNVAAIIAPKNPKYPQQQPQPPQPQSDYLIMSPKVETATMKLQQARNAAVLNTSATMRKSGSDFLSTPTSSGKQAKAPAATPLKLQLLATPTQQQYKRKHVPNILAEINKRMSQPNSPTTPTKLALPPTKASKQSPNALLKAMESSAPNMPLQAEFDWYNLDAEYGKAPLQQPDLLKVSEVLNSGSMLAEIHEDHESVVAAADEYNLDEEFSLACDKPDVLNNGACDATDEERDLVVRPMTDDVVEPVRAATKLDAAAALNAAICEAVNFPIFGENSPLVPTASATQQPHNAKAKKMKKNLANFEKFIEGSGLSTKPLPSKRKIYFAGPFV